MSCIHYGAGYKYQLRRAHAERVAIYPAREVGNEWVRLLPDGTLQFKAGYAFDGPSGPTFDTLDSMRGALTHDGLYQLMREGHLDHRVHRAPADAELLRLCIEDGMWKPRAYAWYLMVRAFADPAADPALVTPDRCAPHGPCCLAGDTDLTTTAA